MFRKTIPTAGYFNLFLDSVKIDLGNLLKFFFRIQNLVDING